MRIGNTVTTRDAVDASPPPGPAGAILANRFIVVLPILGSTLRAPVGRYLRASCAPVAPPHRTGGQGWPEVGAAGARAAARSWRRSAPTRSPSSVRLESASQNGSEPADLALTDH
mgnify:CR=1 FL=1